MVLPGVTSEQHRSHLKGQSFKLFKRSGYKFSIFLNIASMFSKKASCEPNKTCPWAISLQLLFTDYESKDRRWAVSRPKCQTSELLNQAYSQGSSSFNKGLPYIQTFSSSKFLVGPSLLWICSHGGKISKLQKLHMKLCIVKIPSNVFQTLFVKVITHECNKTKYFSHPSL